MGGSATEISQDSQEVSIVNRSGCTDKLTEDVHCMGDIRASDCKIDQTTHQVTIARRIR